MQDLKTLIERLKENEIIAQRFHEVESRFLSILNFRDFFEVLVSEIVDKFSVPHVWISIIDTCEISRFLDAIRNSEILHDRINVVNEDEFGKIAGKLTRPLLANKNLDRFAILDPPDDSGSMAIAPLTLDGKLIGTLNQADIADDRFSPGKDTSLLERLAVKVSLCLSNVTAHEKLKYLAYHDPLTGLLNRRVMENVLEREFSRAKRYFSVLSLVFIDLDNFKQVNDRHGHDMGDELLKHVAGIFSAMTRRSDVVARFAGDEFVFLLPETQARQAEAFMERIVARLLETPLYDSNKNPVKVSFSYGVASSDEKDIDDYNLLLKVADERLLFEKKERDSINHILKVIKSA
ncbi:diguanylate cyclase [Desulforegula conservatrix]|uniref:diguanylate cyclase n=1 Tax=Desulforegula conservatrix TaxID=153026 RepID=UPI0004190F99|nr:diguanylate cyclase [Desulforegula conservatrix]